MQIQKNVVSGARSAAMAGLRQRARSISARLTRLGLAWKHSAQQQQQRNKFLFSFRGPPSAFRFFLYAKCHVCTELHVCAEQSPPTSPAVSGRSKRFKSCVETSSTTGPPVPLFLSAPCDELRLRICPVTLPLRLFASSLPGFFFSLCLLCVFSCVEDRFSRSSQITAFLFSNCNLLKRGARLTALLITAISSSITTRWNQSISSHEDFLCASLRRRVVAGERRHRHHAHL